MPYSSNRLTACSLMLLWICGLASASTACVITRLDEPTYEPMCETTADCDPGESCAEGICWGNPPASRFAAVLVPPEGHDDLVPTELPVLDIGSDGWVSELSFAPTAIITGRVVQACGPEAPLAECDPDQSISAQINARRASRILGRRDYVRTTSSAAGLAADAPSFTLVLPLSDEPYEISIIPNRGVSSQTAPSQSDVAPPARFTVDVAGNLDAIVWRVGDAAEHRRIRGRLVDAVGNGIAGMQIAALGQLNPLAAVERVSSLATTDPDGYFNLQIPISVQMVDIQASPLEEGRTPTVYKRGVDLLEAPADQVLELADVRMPSYGAKQRYTLQLQSVGSDGLPALVSGATVRMSTYLSSLVDPSVEATFSHQAVSNDHGNAVIELIPGSGQENRMYVATVDPPASSAYASLYNHVVAVGTGTGGVLEPITLERRVRMSGEVLTATGAPAAGTSIVASLSAGFRVLLEEEHEFSADTLQSARGLTESSGLFRMWVDATLAGIPATYDLDLSPADVLAPFWSVRDIDVSNSAPDGIVVVGTIQVPEASYARGFITAPDGRVVPGAVIRLYETMDAECARYDRPDDGACGLPPILRGQWSSRERDAQVMLVLPSIK